MKRGARLIETLHYDFSLQIVFWDHLQIKWRPDLSQVISLYFPCLTKVKSARDLHARGAEWKGGIRKSSPVLFTFSFPSFLSQQVSCFNQQERTLVTHSSTARALLFLWLSYVICDLLLNRPRATCNLPYNSENKLRRLCFSNTLFKRLIFGGAYIQRALYTEGSFLSKSARLICYWLGGKYASQKVMCSKFLLKLALGT